MLLGVVESVEIATSKVAQPRFPEADLFAHGLAGCFVPEVAGGLKDVPGAMQ